MKGVPLGHPRARASRLILQDSRPAIFHPSVPVRAQLSRPPAEWQPQNVAIIKVYHLQLHQAVYKEGAVLRGERELEKASLRSSETCVHLQILICQYSYGWPGSRRQTSLQTSHQTSLQTSLQTTLPLPGRTAPFVHDILKGICSVLCTGQAWRLPMSQPYGDSLALLPAPVRLLLALQSTLRLGATFTWPCPRTDPSPKCALSTLSP
jgi:hypothetical protein